MVLSDQVDGDAILENIDHRTLFTALDQGFHDAMTGTVCSMSHAAMSMPSLHREREVLQPPVVCIVDAGKIRTDIDEILD